MSSLDLRSRVVKSLAVRRWRCPKAQAAVLLEWDLGVDQGLMALVLVQAHFEVALDLLLPWPLQVVLAHHGR